MRKINLNYKLSFFSSVIFLIFFLQTQPKTELSFQVINNDINSRKNYIFPHNFINTDTQIPDYNKTFTIDQPGYYMLTDNVEVGELALPAINITSSAVRLDLSGFSLTSTSSNTTAPIIRINTNLKNVYVVNGSINGNATSNIITGSGIEVLESCLGIHLENLHIYSSTSAGIALSGTSGNPINQAGIYHCEVANCSGSLSYDSYGIICSYCDDLEIKETVSSSNIHSDSSHNSYGIALNNCNRLIIKNSESNNNSTNNDLGTAYGFYLNNVFASTIQHCHASGNNVSGASASCSAIGFYMNSCRANNIHNNCFNYNYTSNNGSAYGLLDNNGLGNTIQDSSFIDNYGDSEGGGLYLNGCTSCLIRKCSALRNSSSGTAYGIRLGSTTQYCRVSKNYLIASTGTSNGYGLRDDSDPVKNLIDGNLGFAYSTDAFSAAGWQGNGSFTFIQSKTVGNLKGEEGSLSNLLIKSKI